MELNPVISVLGRRLRLAVIGGGTGSFIGAVHRQAARLDNRYEIVTGILSSDSKKSKQAALQIGIAPNRLYASVAEMLAAESSRSAGAEVAAIMTPNDSHFEYAMTALQHGFDVICDKPMTSGM
jgi:predicted dehydrogenase